MHYGCINLAHLCINSSSCKSLLMAFALHSRSLPKRLIELNSFGMVPPLLCTPHMNTVYPCISNDQMSLLGRDKHVKDSKSKQNRFDRFVFLSAFSQAHSGPKHNLGSNMARRVGQNHQTLRICECSWPWAFLKFPVSKAAKQQDPSKSNLPSSTNWAKKSRSCFSLKVYAGSIMNLNWVGDMKGTSDLRNEVAQTASSI